MVRPFIPDALRPANLITARINRPVPRIVMTGPFRGMRYSPNTVIGSVLFPKILGTYELELHSTVEDVVLRAPSAVINVGAGEGYYAVGFAMRLPRARVIAFEENADSRETLAMLARENNVGERIEIRGRCEQGDLSSLLKADSFLLCDVEGFEETLLDPRIEPALEKCEILVEIHEFIVPGVSDHIRSRFENTHVTAVIWQSDRTLADFPKPAWYQRIIPAEYSTPFLFEGRPERMHWLHLRPRKPD